MRAKGTGKRVKDGLRIMNVKLVIQIAIVGFVVWKWIL